MIATLFFWYVLGWTTAFSFALSNHRQLDAGTAVIVMVLTPIIFIYEMKLLIQSVRKSGFGYVFPKLINSTIG
ncbi:MAG: hypothetical protein P4L85_14225 [Paludisphaera borealis]|uniref:hypothetical protein n=1 Tax=Paludisphaera borealis TaxID=1387353 RepID=UPI002852016C|nr:hypothetical protein [Paludisphaera borealis]MDR3620503.1 hypothetical protein [Paludisphaera borealis]